MNIQEAKEEIRRTLRAYLDIPDDDARRIPVSKQRPLLLIGPPGIGKTAVMEQIARECGVGLVSYTMTHHTRQSAIGLPFIREAVFDGKPCSVTEYTMSEILASVYAYQERTGIRRGILFIDEINCVSETLAPVMLQFLQEKTFGSHAVPKGWVIAAAGNPPEYNRSVREFDTATLDRVKVLSVEADYPVWHAYAVSAGVHPAVLSWLSLHPDHFYQSGADRDFKSFVTARGWEDLSRMLQALEYLKEPVKETLFPQYLRHSEIARKFGLYYELFSRYKSGYDLVPFLDGTLSDAESRSLFERFRNAPADERLAVTALLSDALAASVREYTGAERSLRALSELLSPAAAADKDLSSVLARREETLKIRRENGLLSVLDAQRETDLLTGVRRVLNRTGDAALTADTCLSAARRSAKEKASVLSRRLEQAYRLPAAALPDETAILALTTELSKNADAVAYLMAHPSAPFEKWSSRLLLSRREKELREQIKALQS